MAAESKSTGSLRTVMLLVMVPLAAVVVAGVGVELWMARSVHRDLVRLFEELREVALARTLVDELRGVQTWIDASPQARSQTHELVWADVRGHYQEATRTLSRFRRVGDPSDPGHDADEYRLLEQLTLHLRELGQGLDGEAALAELKQAVASALHAASAVSAAVDAESREIGGDLDRRTDDMAQVLVLLGIGSVFAVGGLGWLLLRRVLRPVAELRDYALRIGRGDRSVPVPIGRADELGDLAIAFGDMASQLRQNQNDLEERVEQRSREVLRTAKLAQLGTLAAGIAHEINNPLASIVACSDGLLRGLREGSTAGDELREYLEILHKEAMRARDITAKLLRFAHDDQARRERVRLGEQVREVATLFDHQLQDAGVTFALVCERHDEADIDILGDAAEWRQVFFNLLRNALDASPRGGRIVVELRRRGAEVEIVVQDQGPGVPAAALEQVFEPFFTTKGPGKGTGLGLAIVHRIVTAHGGRIRIVDAAPGACVVISMPAFDDAG